MSDSEPSEMQLTYDFLNGMRESLVGSLGTSVPASLTAFPSAEEYDARIESPEILEMNYIAALIADAPGVVLPIVEYYNEKKGGLTEVALRGIDKGLIWALGSTYEGLLTNPQCPLGDVWQLLLKDEFDLLKGLFFALPDVVIGIQSGLKKMNPDFSHATSRGKAAIRSIANLAISTLIGHQPGTISEEERFERLAIAFGVIARMNAIKDDIHLRRAGLMYGTPNPFAIRVDEGVFIINNQAPQSLFAMALTDEGEA